ncbi:DNA topoisomerase VI [archaeon CG10_big_fil_rev_8_21_14_0_10_43_11]|nr:MAG: DNA topoisomerase VI [archaeon CG10_big_fil_rev_8_21_14_0_10_43_11]
MVNKQSEEKGKRDLAKLKKLGEQILAQLEVRKNPTLSIPIRSLSNTYYDEKKGILQIGNKTQKRYYLNLAHARKFMQNMLVAAETKKLIESGKTTSIRDLYYMLKHTISNSKENTFEEQEESNPMIEDLEVELDILREDLHLYASNRGSLVGNITIEDSGDTIEARRMGSGGWNIPSIVEDDVINFKNCDADFVLFCEKDAMWRRLNEDKFWQKHNCILMHGQGMAPRGVRRLLHRIDKELKLPIIVFVDNDPWGLYIYSVIKQGSINLAYESKRMAVPKARFVGLSSYDQEKFKLPNNVSIKLTNIDIKRSKEMLAYQWFQKKDWQDEIKHMLKKGVKLELEALSNKGISFASETYLPQKIKNEDYLT